MRKYTKRNYLSYIIFCLIVAVVVAIITAIIFLHGKEDYEDKLLGNNIVRFYNNSQLMPDISFEDANGNLVSLKDFHDKIVIISLWATWCKPCVKEMPLLDRLAKEYSDTALVILPISLDFNGASAVSEFYNKHNINNLPIFLDKNQQVFRTLKANGLPYSVIIKDKKLIADVNGDIDWLAQDVKAVLNKLL